MVCQATDLFNGSTRRIVTIAAIPITYTAKVTRLVSGLLLEGLLTRPASHSVKKPRGRRDR
jgi:hypothetical protein